MKGLSAMKKLRKVFLSFLPVLLAVMVFSGCDPVDKSYGVESSDPQSDNSASQIPEIKSSDTVMSNFFDISKYDEENYADIYLGRKFEYKITYSGSELTLPTDYKDFTKKGWRLSSGYDESESVFAGDTREVIFENKYGNIITAVFYNSEKSSLKLKKCDIVEYSIPENSLNIKESKYGQFWINGVNNGSAITDIIDYLGAPSHFYTADGNNYSLDYFISKNDKKSKMNINVDVANDTVISVKISKY